MEHSKKARIVVLISGSGSNLQAIINAANNHQLNAEVVGVISNRADAYGLIRADTANIPNQIIQHTSYDSRDDFEQALSKAINSYQPDVVILAGFMRILGSGFVQLYSGRMLNIHPSLLPKYQGLDTHRRALAAGDKEHGISIHFVTEKLDGGPIVAQAKIDVLESDTEHSLSQRAQQLEHQLYPQVIGWFCEKRLKLTAQGAELDGQLINFD